MATRPDVPGFVRGDQERAPRVRGRICHPVHDVIRSADHPLTIVAAPAGYGKSRLLDDLAVSAGADRLAVERRSLDQCAVGGPAAIRADLVLVDDAHRASPGRLERLVRAITSTRAAPGRTRYVVATRELPEIDWLSLELDGSVRLVRMSELALDETQISAIAGNAPGGMSAEELAALLRWSEGWPMAVHLCALIAPRLGGFDGAMREAARSGDIARFFGQELFSEQDDAMKSFLLALSNFERFDAAMVGELLGASAVGLLARARQKNLMILPDGRDGGGRLHPLFRAFLGDTRLRSGIPVDRTLLRRAASWAFSNGRCADGIDYLLRAGRIADAQRELLARAHDLFEDAGEVSRLLRWADAIEAATGSLAPGVRLWRAWALTLALDLEAARRQLERADADLAADAEEDTLTHRDRLHISIAAQDGRHSEVVARSGQWIARWGESRPFHAAAVSALQALALHALGEPAAGRRALADARRLARGGGRTYAHLWVVAIETLLEVEAGRPMRACAIVERELQECVRGQFVAPAMVALLEGVAARATAEVGATDRARRHLTAALQVPAQSGIVDTKVALLEASALLSNGDIDLALSRLRAADAPGRRVARLTGERAVTLLLAAERWAEARAVFDAELAGDPVGTPTRDMLALALSLAEGGAGDLGHQFDSLVRRFEMEGRGRLLIAAHLLSSGAAAGSDRPAAARRSLQRAIRLASDGGSRRTAMDFAWAVAALLREPDGEQGLSAGEAALCRAMRAELRIDPDAVGEAMVEPLTRREAEVLLLLDSGLTSERLAERMAMGQSTAKWHIKNIYAKLGVHNRSGALARARQLALL